MKSKKQAENTQILFILAIIQSTCFTSIASSGLNASLSVSLTLVTTTCKLRRMQIRLLTNWVPEHHVVWMCKYTYNFDNLDLY